MFSLIEQLTRCPQKVSPYARSAIKAGRPMSIAQYVSDIDTEFSSEQIALDLDVSRDTVAKTLVRLMHEGIVQRVKKTNRGYIWSRVRTAKTLV